MHMGMLVVLEVFGIKMMAMVKFGSKMIMMGYLNPIVYKC